MKIKKKCSQCHNFYISRFRLSKFCSRKCYGKWRSKNIIGQDSPTWRGGLITNNCLICKTELKTVASRIKMGRGKYCSKKCAFLGQKRGKNKSCIICSKIFYVRNSEMRNSSKKYYCSVPCYHIFLKGDNPNPNKSHPNIFKGKKRLELAGAKNPNWKGGINPINDTIRKSLESQEWKWKVTKRDNYTCQVCGQKGGILNANHIKKFADYPKMRFELNNGITLCRNCHIKLVNHHEPEWEFYFNFNLQTRGFIEDKFISN